MVKMVIVGDDCALPTKGKTAGRRGLAGTVYVHKIAGAIAEFGGSLDDVHAAAAAAAASVGTMGVALSPCIVPGRPASFALPPSTVELGMYSRASRCRVNLLPGFVWYSVAC